MDPATLISFVTTAAIVPLGVFAAAFFLAFRVSVPMVLTCALSATLSWTVIRTAPLSELIPFVSSTILSGSTVWFFIALCAVLFFFVRGAFGESFDNPGFLQALTVSLGFTIVFLGIVSNGTEFHAWYAPPALVTQYLNTPAYHVWAIVAGWVFLAFGRDRI